MTFEEIKNHLETCNIVNALWWFVENVNEESPHRSEVFFYLRERVRGYQGNPRLENSFAKNLKRL